MKTKVIEVTSLGIPTKGPNKEDIVIMGCACCMCDPKIRGAGDTTAKQGSSKLSLLDASIKINLS